MLSFLGAVPAPPVQQAILRNAAERERSVLFTPAKMKIIPDFIDISFITQK